MNSEKVKHTPGPWIARDGGEVMRGFPSKSSRFTVHCGTEKNYGNAVAIVELGSSGATRYDSESVSANAHLIAAAPELLAFAKLFEVYCNENCQTGEVSWDALQIAARSAIAKALNQPL